MRRALRLALGAAPCVAVAAAMALAPLGCSGSTAANAPDRGPGDAGAIEAAADVEPTPLPYPAGPYGGGVGDVLPNFTVQGYAMSPTQRDSSVLPWREIHLGEARTPSCTCMIVVLGVVGLQCQPALIEDQLLATTVAQDPSMCALVAINANFDGENPAKGPAWLVSPPTRADVDDFTQYNRETFPIGIVTESARTALSAKNAPFDPLNFIVRTSDMRVMGFATGLSAPLAATAKQLCGAPTPQIEDLAGAVSPRRIVLDGGDLFFTDEARGVLRVPIGGGTPVVIAATEGPADALAVDASYVYWATHEGAATFEIARAPRGGGDATRLTSGASGYRGISLDATHVYFTRDDGVVGYVPKAGGAVTVLASQELAPTSILVDDDRVYFVASGSGEIASVAKGTGVRTSLEAPPPPANEWTGGTGGLAFFNAELVALVQGSIDHVARSGTGISPMRRDPGIFRASTMANVPWTNEIYTGTGDPLLGPGLIVRDTNGILDIVTGGQDGLYDMQVDDHYVYWSVRSGGGAANGAIRRLAR